MTIADQSGTAELDLWQEYVGVVTTGKSYVIRNAMAKFYNEQFRLTTPKSGLIIEHAQELTGITAVVKNKPNRSLKEAKVIAVRSLQSNIVCVSCNSKDVIAMEDNPCLGSCSKCSTRALLSVCEHQTSADLIIKSQSFCYKVSAVGKQLADIAELADNEAITEVKLLMSSKFDCEYSAKMMITSVYRESYTVCGRLNTCSYTCLCVLPSIYYTVSNFNYVLLLVRVHSEERSGNGTIHNRPG